MRKNRLVRHMDHENTICSVCMHQNLPFFMKKTAKKWPVFGQKLTFSASDKQLKTPPPLF